jgi:hypothetical protein
MLGFGSKYLIAALAGAGAIISIWTHGYSTGANGKAAAVTARDVYWQEQIKEANEAHEESAQHAEAEGAKVVDTPDDLSERIRVCESSPTCRNR